jgi:hypothetical protein
MPTFEEKRRITRADYGVSGKALYKDRSFKGEILNFSLNGFLFRSDEVMDVAEGEKVAISIDPDGEMQDMASEISCTVMRKTDNVLGVKFKVIDYDTLMFLKKTNSYYRG